MATPADAPFKRFQRWAERRCRMARLMYPAYRGPARRIVTPRGVKYVPWTEPSGRKGAKWRK